MRNKFIHYPLVMALMLLFCVPCVTVTYAQSFTVIGTVTDSQGGIPGANVKVKVVPQVQSPTWTVSLR